MKTHTLTSLNIYEFEYTDLEHIDIVLSEILNANIEYKKPGTDMGDYGYLNLLHKVPYYNNKLFTWIQSNLDIITDLHFRNLKFAICDSWIVRTKFTESSIYHKHNQSVLSGLFYFTDHLGSETIFTYTDMFVHPYEYLLSGEEYNRFFKSTPKKGKLLIWPSYLEHRVSNHKDFKNTRYTLAFNCFPTGVMRTTPTCQLDLHVKSVKEKFEEHEAFLDKAKDFYK